MSGKIIVLETTASTNDAIRGEGYGHMDAVIALHQTAGRGQKGNKWEAEPGKNLTFSVLLETEVDPAGQFLITQAVSLAIVDALKRFGIDAVIKWPNDIYVGDKKIAGILIENDILGRCIIRSVAGIGLNVNQVRFSPEIPNPTSTLLETGRESDIMELFGAFMECIAKRLGESAELLNSHYRGKLYRLGTRSGFLDAEGRPFEAVIEGVEPSGELIVESEGIKRTFLFKEIEYVI